MEKVKRCEYWDCGWCYHEDGPKNGCVGRDKCTVSQMQTKDVRAFYREDIKEDMYWCWYYELDAHDFFWDMLAEYFTIE